MYTFRYLHSSPKVKQIREYVEQEKALNKLKFLLNSYRIQVYICVLSIVNKADKLNITNKFTKIYFTGQFLNF
jgi:hypothetical protein